jgi:ADP-heptose:LPS heptosyltransferase
VRDWAGRVGAAGFKVGLVWAGNPGHKHDAKRSIAPQLLSTLCRAPGVTWFSLQKGLPPPPRVIDLAADFVETAAAMQHLDLVISVDTSVAHLAGALGKPVWTLLTFAPDYRWFLDREDSPWYPTMRLFRQPAPGDWPSVLERVAQALEDLTNDS